MQDLAAIAALYNEIDAYFEQQRAAASAQNDSAGVKRIEEKQRLNDQAYFILCWGQLETTIDEVCREAIRRRKDDPDWNIRRAWDLYNPDDKKLSGLSFEERAALVLDRKGGRGSPWAKVMDYYALRNQIAHGTLRSHRIDVPAVVTDFYQTQSALSR